MDYTKKTTSRFDLALEKLIDKSDASGKGFKRSLNYRKVLGYKAGEGHLFGSFYLEDLVDNTSAEISMDKAYELFGHPKPVPMRYFR